MTKRAKKTTEMTVRELAEATAEFIFRTLRDEIPKSTPGLLGGLLIRPGVRRIRERMD